MAGAMQYVTLGVANELFAAPVECVREILDTRKISALPNAPAYLLGMIDVRGAGVPVIDLRLKLGLEAAAETQNTRIVVLTISTGGRDLLLGLRADKVFEVTGLDADQIEPVPEIGTRWRSEVIAGIGRRNGEFVTVLNLDRLFASEELPLLSSASVERAA